MSDKRFEGHTPGEWSLVGSCVMSGDCCICVIEDDFGYECPPEQRGANGKLIAAAPAILAENARLRDGIKLALIDLHNQRLGWGGTKFLEMLNAHLTAVLGAEMGEK